MNGGFEDSYGDPIDESAYLSYGQVPKPKEAECREYGRYLLDVDYDGGSAETYRGMVLYFMDTHERFFSSDPVADYAAAVERAKEFRMNVYTLPTVHSFCEGFFAE